MAGDLSGDPQIVKRREKGRNWALKTGKAELCGPASLCDVEPHARSGRSVGLARPFGLWITRSAPWSPMKRRRDPTTVLILRRVATTWLRPWPGRNQSAEGFVAQRTPATPPHGMRRGRQTVALCAYSPLRLQPLMAMGDPGLACPVSLPTVSRSRSISPPTPSTTGLPTNKAYMSGYAAHQGRGAYPRYPPAPCRGTTA